MDNLSIPSATTEVGSGGKFRAEKKVPVLEIMEAALEPCLEGAGRTVTSEQPASELGSSYFEGVLETMLSGRMTDETRLFALLGLWLRVLLALPPPRLRMLLARLALWARRAYSSGGMYELIRVFEVRFGSGAGKVADRVMLGLLLAAETWDGARDLVAELFAIEI